MTRRRKLLIGGGLLLFTGFILWNPWLRLVEVKGFSMWPALFNGDVLLVIGGAEPSEGDIVLLQPADGKSRVVKRCVVRGPAVVSIVDGDVLVSDRVDSSDRFFRRRSAENIRATCIPVFSLKEVRREDLYTLAKQSPSGGAAGILIQQGSAALADRGGQIKLRGNPPTRVRVPAVDIQDDHVTSSPDNSTRQISGRNPVSDLVIEFEMTVPDPGTRVLLLCGTTGLILTADVDQLTWSWTEEPETPLVRHSREGLETLSCSFLAVDGDLYCLVPTSGGRLEFHRTRPSGPASRAAFVEVEVAGGELEIRRLDIARDIHYIPFQNPAASGLTKDAPWPIEVPAGMIYVLGDNPPVSEDSRNFGSVPKARVIGVPLAILWPPGRASWLF